MQPADRGAGGAAIASDHPPRSDAPDRLLDEAGAGPSVVERLIPREELEEVAYGGSGDYVAKFFWRQGSGR